MLEAFKTYFYETYKLQETQKLAVATSGGVDSMVLCHLLLECGIPFSILHCNFHLRGEFSDGDTEFVESFAKEHGIDFEKIDFDTKAYAVEKATSIQISARELRYAWFDKMKKEKNLTWIATAHHLDDDIETLLINLGRGTGIRGLIGIPDKDNGYIRPLLKFTKEQIVNYAKSRKILWREDASNQLTDYLRNSLRINVIPTWKKEVADLEIGFSSTKKHLSQALDLQKDYINLIKTQVWKETEFGVQIDLPKLISYPNTAALLYELLYTYGFTAWEDVVDLVQAQSGKMVLSPTYRLIKDREVFLLSKIKEKSSQTSIQLHNSQQLNALATILEKNTAKAFILETKRSIFVSEKKISFPLELRLWKQGDYFYPAGMTGKKKLSKFFKDEKYSILEKEAIWVLCSQDKIIWVVGHRMDNRFVVEKPGDPTISISI